MGYCILFPWLCGLRTSGIAEMKQILLDHITEFEKAMETTDDITQRMAIIEVYRGIAIKILNDHGMSPYNIEVTA